MTIICVKDGVIAADSGVWHGNIHSGSMLKIRRMPETIGGGYAAGSGGAARVSAALDLVEAQGLAARIPDDDGISLIWLRGDGTVWAIEKEASFQIHAPFHAEGSGKAVALGAMAAGASAEEAVRISCDLEQNCRGPVNWSRI